MVHGLNERRIRLEAECANLRTAVAAAREPSVIGVLVKDMEDRQREMELLAHKIAEAEALVEPLLLPKPSSVTDYLAGRASLFTGIVHEDRLLLERVLDRIVVYASGDVVVYFRGRICSTRSGTSGWRRARGEGQRPPPPRTRRSRRWRPSTGP